MFWPRILGVWYFSPSFKQSITPVTCDTHLVGQPDLCPLCWPQSPPFLSPPVPCKDLQGSCERAGLPIRALCLSQVDRARLLNMSLSSFLLTCPSFSLANLNKQQPVQHQLLLQRWESPLRRGSRNRQQWPPENVPGIIPQLLQAPCEGSCPISSPVQSGNTSLAGVTPKTWF